jgi:RNA polymerase primary sigma factor
VEGFNPELNLRLSTYAAWWIKQAIRRALINRVPAIRVPPYMVELISKWKKATRDLHESLGRAPTLEELATRMAVSRRLTRTIAQAGQATLSTRQMDAADGEGLTLDERLEDQSTPAPERVATDRDDLMRMRALLQHIEPRGANVLRMRFGLEDEQALTLQEIAVLMGLTRERVRQIEKGALQELARLVNSKHARLMWASGDEGLN